MLAEGIADRRFVAVSKAARFIADCAGMLQRTASCVSGTHNDDIVAHTLP